MIVLKLIEYCKINCLSILFGGSAFDKKMALHAIRQGVEAGIFCRTGFRILQRKCGTKVLRIIYLFFQ